MTMNGDGGGQSRRGAWLVALVTLGLMAMVAWDQLHVRPGDRGTPAARPAAAGASAVTKAAASADTAAAPSPVVPREASSDAESTGDSGADELPNGQHAM
jgi:hypothetical protein